MSRTTQTWIAEGQLIISPTRTIADCRRREDAELLAAAPDMAAALREIAAMLRDVGTDGKLALRNAEDAYQMATAALAKAGV